MSFLAALARNLTAAALCAAALVSARPAMAGDPLAKLAFGAEKLPASGPAQSIGFYSKGCFEGGVGLPPEGARFCSMTPLPCTRPVMTCYPLSVKNWWSFTWTSVVGRSPGRPSRSERPRPACCIPVKYFGRQSCATLPTYCLPTITLLATLSQAWRIEMPPPVSFWLARKSA